MKVVLDTNILVRANPKTSPQGRALSSRRQRERLAYVRRLKPLAVPLQPIHDHLAKIPERDLGRLQLKLSTQLRQDC